MARVYYNKLVLQKVIVNNFFAKKCKFILKTYENSLYFRSFSIIRKEKRGRSLFIKVGVRD